MAADFGVSFTPGQSGPGQQGGAVGSGPISPPVQQAIQLLSLRLPRVTGANALAPSALLNGPGSQGMTLQQLLAQMFGQQPQNPQGPQMGGPGAGMAPAPMAPTPHITPGDGGQPGGPVPVPTPGQPPTQSPRDIPGIDRTMPGGFRGTFRPGPWGRFGPGQQGSGF